MGKFERTEQKNYEEFLKALGVNLLLRKAALISTPIMEVSLDQGVWTIKQSTTLKTMEMKFMVGVECDDVTPDGREVKMIVTNEEGAFLMLQKAKKLGEKSTKSTRKMVGKNEMIYTMEVVGEPDTLCVQKFKRIA